ncbi:LysR family transcriptional regulator [Desulfosarcina sp.]|uniref:LysR family transcriptional regulator n=1 Tax=Desulfosarcina sp. TaxID=2027861 RepID=UPI0029B9D3D9|nr:LysR family transcriptional regulator [Desulfosarcina sp.]MDX2454357.1 LysR family transcriptional regulator [Desulfosarcina sp.]
MSFDLKNLELFVRLAALGAIGKAEAEFKLSATNATLRIKALETDFGVKLLNRTTRAVSLTPDGEILLEYAKRILDDVEDARLVLSQTTQSVSGVLRVTASASFGRSHIVPFVQEFLGKFREVTLNLNLSDANVDIVKHGYDLAFRIGEFAPSSLLAQRVDENPQWLVAAPDYLARAGQLDMIP